MYWFTLQTTVYVCLCVLGYSVVSNSLWPHRLLPGKLLRLWDFPGKITGTGFHFLLQGSSWPRDLRLHDTHLLCLLIWQADSLPLSHPGSPCRLDHTITHMDYCVTLLPFQFWQAEGVSYGSFSFVIGKAVNCFLHSY